MSEQVPFEPIELHAGAHEIRIEAPDFVAYRFRGPVASEELRRLVVVERAIWEGLERVLVFVELEDATLLPGILSTASEAYRGAPPRLLAAVGMSFSMRMGLDMVARPLQLLGFRNIVRHFPDEASARAWLHAQRGQRELPGEPERKSTPEAR